MGTVAKFCVWRRMAVAMDMLVWKGELSNGVPVRRPMVLVRESGIGIERDGRMEWRGRRLTGFGIIMGFGFGNGFGVRTDVRPRLIGKCLEATAWISEIK